MQVYEREAILAHLAQNDATDPLSNAPLPNTVLTPVFPMKSRAIELRERVAKACVQRACSLDCKEPVKHLRRAAELCADVDVRVPGLSPQVISYLQTHASSAYDTLALKLFAENLRGLGYIDQAANTYYRLLQLGDDRSQQAEALQQCLACWAAEDWADGGASSADIIPKLAAFTESCSNTFSAGAIVEMMRDVNEKLAMGLCEHLLGKASEESEPKRYRELLFKYIQMRTSGGAPPSPEGSAAGTSGRGLADAEAKIKLQVPAPGQKRKDGGGKAPRQPIAQVVNKHRHWIASGVFAVASLLDSKHVLLRALRAASVLFLVHDARGRRPTSSGSSSLSKR